MNKQTLIFVLLVSASFFVVNIYFGKQRDKERRAQLKEQSSQEIKEKAHDSLELKNRTASLSSLPLTKIYNENNEILFNGIEVKGGVLTLAWSKNLPKNVFVNGVNFELGSEDYAVGSPILYTSSQFENIDIAALPETGSYDVQLLSFTGNEPQVNLGVYRDGTLTFPGAKPKSDALVLFNADSGYLPFGFYESQGDIFIELQKLPNFTSLVKSAPIPEVKAAAGQQYYVLENEYQQIVFTNVGGAVSEINLPFETKENQKSVVKEIEFDRRIANCSPEFSLFPSVPYYSYDSDQPQKGQLGGYYPLIRRALKNPISPEYYAFNIVSEYPEMAELVFDVVEFTKNKIVFVGKTPLRKITKIYTLAEQQAPYCFDLSIKIEGSGKGLWLTSGVPEVEIMSNNSSPQIQYRLTRKGKTEVEKLDLPKEKEIITVSSVHPDWVVNSNGYLGIIMDPTTNIGPGYRTIAINGSEIPTRLTLIDPQYQPYKAAKYPGYEIFLPLPNNSGTYTFRAYAGPFEENTLKAVDKIYTDQETGQNPNYLATRTFYGFFSFVSEPFAKFLFIVMKFFYYITHSWAASIILLTIFLRVLLYPLNAWSMKSMRRMQEISPQVQAIQKKHKKDPKKSQMEIMQLYREEKVNPFMGCFPILIQLPFLIGMFDLLKSSFQLRGAGFIPGWIDNLTAPDVLFSWNRPIFFIGNEFHLLPFILGAVMFVQQRLSSPVKEGVEMTDQQRQQKAMGTMMAVLFTFMFYHFPSGLNIYWLSSMLLGIGQQWMTNRMLNKKKGISTKKSSDGKGKKIHKILTSQNDS